jgi:hypothetical protein
MAGERYLPAPLAGDLSLQNRRLPTSAAVKSVNRLAFNGREFTQ